MMFSILLFFINSYFNILDILFIAVITQVIFPSERKEMDVCQDSVCYAVATNNPQS